MTRLLAALAVLAVVGVAALAAFVWGYVAGYRHGWRNGSKEQHDGEGAWPDAVTVIHRDR
jgi:hypothetical protein